MSRILVLLLFCLLSFPTPLGAADDTKAVLEKVFTSPHEANGDYDLLVKELIELFKENLNSPARGVIFNKMAASMAHVTDPALMDGFIQELVVLAEKDGLQNGFLESVLKTQKREILLRKGDVEEADAMKVYETWPQKVLVLGPLGFAASSLHDTVFSPEPPLDELSPATGYAGQVSWVELERSKDKSYFNPYDSIYPKRGCCFTLYQYQVPKKTEILISFSSRASFKIWCNNELVKDIDRRKAYYPNRFLLPILAEKGWNRVLIKFSAGVPTFKLRITDQQGYPLPGITEPEEMKLMPLSSPASGYDPSFDAKGIDTLSFLKDYVEKNPEDPYASLAFCINLAGFGLASEAVAEGEKAITLSKDNPFVLFNFSKILDRAGHLPRNYRTNKTQEILKKIKDINKDFLPARLNQARYDHQNDRSEDAIKTINDILLKNPKYYQAAMTLCDIYEHLGWRKELLNALTAAKTLAPKNPESLIMQAHYYQSIDRHDLANDWFKKALAQDNSRADIMEKIAAFLWNTEKKTEALDLYQQILNLSDSDFDKERLAGLHQALGNLEETEKIYTQLKDKNPKNPRYYARLGDIRMMGDKNDEAAQWYLKALELKPSEHALREMLEDWKKLKDPLFTDFAPDAEAVLKNIPGKKSYPKASSICALDHMITKVYEDGAIKSEVFQIIKILDKDAVKEFGKYYAPGRILTLKVINPNGEQFEPVDAEGTGEFNMPGMDVGSILVVRYLLFGEHSVGKNLRLGRFYFQDTGCSQPFLLSRHIVSVPKSLNLSLEKKGPKNYEEEVIDRDTDQVYVFTARNSPVAVRENRMPIDEDAFPNVDFYQPGDWKRTAQIMANNFWPTIRLTQELITKAQEITKGLNTDLEKIQTIYEFVNNHVIEDSGSSSATSVLIEGRGNRTSLFCALLDASRVKYEYLRCGYKPGYLAAPPNWSDVSGSLLPNELVRALPKDAEPKILAFNSRYTPFGELPPELLGAPLMRVTGKPERIEILPQGDPSQWTNEVTELNIKVDLLDAHIEGRFYLPGFSRIRFQESMKRMDSYNRKKVFENQILRSIFPGAEVDRLNIRGIDDQETVPTFEFKLLAKDFIQPIGERDGFKVLQVPMDLSRIFIQKVERSFPFVYRGYTTLRLVMDIDFKENFELVELPDSLVERCHFLNYSLILTKTEKGLRIERHIDFSPADINPAQYPELVDAIRTIDEREVAPIILRQKINKPVAEEKDK